MGGSDKNPKAWLIGDIKLTMRLIHDKVTSNNKQWQAVASYANYGNNHQFAPLTFFIV